MDFNGHHEPIIRRLKNEPSICWAHFLTPIILGPSRNAKHFHSYSILTNLIKPQKCLLIKSHKNVDALGASQQQLKIKISKSVRYTSACENRR